MTAGACVPPECAWPPTLVGQARIIEMAFHDEDLGPLIQGLVDRLRHDARDAGALMDLASICIVRQKRADGLALQSAALGLERVFRQQTAAPTHAALRVLMVAGPGDFMANLPIGFLLEDADVSLDLVYALPGEPFPPRVPAHDLAIIGVGESDESRPLLDMLAPVVDGWRVPVLLDPRRIVRLSRDALWTTLSGAPGLQIPATRRVGRDSVASLAQRARALDDVVPGVRYPIILRPVGSHAGHGLEKIDGVARFAGYLEEQPAGQFYVSQFVDYRSADGLFRKYRVALVDGRPFACHMAVADHWMLHYLNAGMEQRAEKRAEEARWFDTFDDVFARRHGDAFRALYDRVGLEYVVVDCGETPGGDLLIFEADTAMVVHAMDSPALFPYKPPQMRKVFRAFQAMLHEHAGRTPPRA